MSAPLLNYLRDNGVSIEITRGKNSVHLKKDLTHGAHSSVVNKKYFGSRYISSQIRSGRVSILSLEYIEHLQGLYISLLDPIT